MPRMVDVDKLKDDLDLLKIKRIVDQIQKDSLLSKWQTSEMNFWGFQVLKSFIGKHLEKYAVIVDSNKIKEEKPKQRSISPELEAALADLFVVNKGPLARRIKAALDNCKENSHE